MKAEHHLYISLQRSASETLETALEGNAFSENCAR